MIEKRIKQIQQDLEIFDNELEKYDYIIDLGKELEGLEEDKKREEYLVKGCTSNLWLVPEVDDERVVFRADADAVIVKGLAKIFTDVFSGLPKEEIKNFDRDLLQDLGLDEIISRGRQSGFSKAIEKIKDYSKGV